MYWTRVSRGVSPKIEIRDSLPVKYVDIIRFNDPLTLSFSLPLLPSRTSWLMPRHWSLPRRQPFIFLNQHHSLSSRIHIRGERRKTTSFQRRRNQPLAGRNYRLEDDPGTRIRVSHARPGVCMRVQKYTCDDRPPKKKLPTSTVRLCMTSAG